MLLKNKTKGTIVANFLWLAYTFSQRVQGLLGTRLFPLGYGLIIKPCSSMHTFGMNYPIDVLFVDGNNRIIKIVDNMLPGNMSMSSGSKYVVELPAGTANRTVCSVGDILEFQ